MRVKILGVVFGWFWDGVKKYFLSPLQQTLD
jgi:hypothetical protein